MLALLPGLFAAYGGLLAAESVTDKKRQAKIKTIFWLMFVLFVLATGWQQFRVAEADLARDTRGTWADAMALRVLQSSQTVPPFWSVKSSTPIPAVKPDIAIALLYPKQFSIVLLNRSNALLNKPKWWFGIWNLDHLDADGNPTVLPIPSAGGDWIRAHESMGPQVVMGQVASMVKDGDRLFGFMGASCPTCIRTRTYWVYAVEGKTGWYSEVQNGNIDLARLSASMPQIQKNPEQFLSGIPEKSRISIAETLSDIH